VQGKGDEPNFMSGVNNEQEQEPRGERGGRHLEGEKRGWHYSPRQKPSWRSREGGGRSHDDFPGAEISITGGVGEIVHGLTTVTFFFFFFFFFFFSNHMFIISTVQEMTCIFNDMAKTKPKIN